MTPDFRAETGQRPVDAIAYNHPQSVDEGTAVRLVYRLEVNHYRGRDSLNLIVEHVLAAESAFDLN